MHYVHLLLVTKINIMANLSDETSELQAHQDDSLNLTALKWARSYNSRINNNLMIRIKTKLTNIYQTYVLFKVASPYKISTMVTHYSVASLVSVLVIIKQRGSPDRGHSPHWAGQTLLSPRQGPLGQLRHEGRDEPGHPLGALCQHGLTELVTA